MAPRTAFLLLALLGAVMCLHGVAHADDATTGEARAAVVKSSDEQGNTEVFPGTEVGSFDETAEDSESSGTEVADVDGEVAEHDDLSPAHPLARMLREHSSKKKCWHKKHCKKYFKKPGCCKRKCVNLASDNKNCGKCRRHCKVKKGYHCRSGKCRKVKKHKHHSKCGKHKKCKKGQTCCKGKCIWAKHDPRNCGACGKRCGFGKKCCHGYCKNVFGNDEHHCGACGKKCHTECKFGICGYGQ